MLGHLYLAPGDLTQLAADALAYSASNTLSKGGQLYPSFRRHVPGFVEQYEALQPPHDAYPVGRSFWVPLSADRPPHGVALVVATGGDRTVEDKAALSVRAALDTAVPQLRRLRGPDEQLLVALPAFRVGG